VSALFSADIVANTVIMVRTVDRTSSALIIEGDKDGRIFKKVIDTSRCKLYAAGSRVHAERALAILLDAKQPGVLAVIDADTDHIVGKTSGDINLILTHTRDSECMLLSAPIMRPVLIEFDLAADAFGPDPERSAIEAAALVGYARFVIEAKKWRVRLGEMEFKAFIDSGNLRCNVKALCNHLAGLAATPGITAAELEDEINALISRKIDPFKVARGHDVTSMLAWAIATRSGKKRKDGATIEGFTIESFLRAVYPEAEFALTELARKINEWEKQNHPFKVLSEKQAL
jgi:Protein of unknown function (DUF4435)